MYGMCTTQEGKHDESRYSERDNVEILSGLISPHVESKILCLDVSVNDIVLV